MRTSQTAATSFTDRRDNKTYRIVQIGDQVWMAENLNYQTGNSWCYDDNEANCTKYGRLYDWHTAVNACPAGWQLANDDDWHILVQVVGGSTIAGIKLGSKNGWVSGSLGGAVVVGTDNFGFSALPGGYRHRPVEGSYYTYLGNNGFWWSATENVDNIAYIQCILYFNEDMLRYRADKNQGLSVRCIRRD
jgi:uncharacterized protein (TIGR02145 family)